MKESYPINAGIEHLLVQLVNICNKFQFTTNIFCIAMPDVSLILHFLEIISNHS